MGAITKAERTELKSIVRNQFKVLRAEVEQREAELMAEVDDQISDRFSDEDKAWSDAATLANEAILEANRRLNDIYRNLLGDRHEERMYARGSMPDRPTQKRLDLRMQAKCKLVAQVQAAQLRLQRQEADLLRTLAVGALETAEAHAFLSAIPTVSELVPAARLAELEASLAEGGA